MKVKNSGEIPEGRASAQYFFGFIIPAKHSGCHTGWIIHVDLKWLASSISEGLACARGLQSSDNYPPTHLTSHRPQRRWFRVFVSSKCSTNFSTVLAEFSPPFFQNPQSSHSHTSLLKSDWAAHVWFWPWICNKAHLSLRQVPLLLCLHPVKNQGKVSLVSITVHSISQEKGIFLPDFDLNIHISLLLCNPCSFSKSFPQTELSVLGSNLYPGWDILLNWDTPPCCC